MKRSIYLTAIVILSGLLLSCSKEDTPEKEVIDKVKIAHYTFSTDYSDLIGKNTDAKHENTKIEDNAVFMDGNYLWDDDQGSVLWIPKIDDWNLDEFQLALSFKLAELPTHQNPILVLGYNIRWAILDVTKTGQLNLAFNDKSAGTNLSEKSIVPDKWTNLEIERNKEGVFSVKIDGEILFQETGVVISHKGDNSLAAFHGGIGKMFHGYWRDLIIRQ